MQYCNGFEYGLYVFITFLSGNAIGAAGEARNAFPFEFELKNAGE